MSNQASPPDDQGLLKSEFLRQCHFCLFGAQGNPAYASPNGIFHESFTVFVEHGNRHGMPSFRLTPSPSWEFFGSGDFPIAIDISADRRIQIGQSDDPDPVYLEFRLRYPFEIIETLELVSGLTPQNAAKSPYKEIPWSSVVDDIFVLFAGADVQRLLKFSWAEWESQYPDLLDPIREFFKGRPAQIGDQYSTWSDWLERKRAIERVEGAGELKDDDLLFSPDDGFQGAAAALSGYKAWDDRTPRFVIRLKAQQSRLYFIDFIQNSQEGGLLWNMLHRQFKEFTHLLTTSKVRYPAGRLTQIRLGLELRVAKFEYEDKVRSLTTIREPAERMLELYQLRTRNVEQLHSGYLSAIEAINHPLPYLIEWPLRRFQRTDDRFLQISYGSQLLTNLLKFPLFSLLEEIAAKPETKPLSASIEVELYEKPASDGTLLKHLGDLQRIVSDTRVQLPFFGPLLTAFMDRGYASALRLIEARNRFHHPPNEWKPLLDAFGAEIPPLIGIFRETLADVTIVSPISQNHKEGKHIVEVWELMGFEADFPTAKFETTAPYELFPLGEVVAVNLRKDLALPLSRFFKSQPIESIAIDIGIFDRMKKGQREFVFVRGQSPR